jgi:predicted nucleotidyltransferase
MLQKCNLWNVASVFFDNPEKRFELMGISKTIKLAHTSVKKHLQVLIELKIVLKGFAEFGNKKNPCYYADRRNPEFIHYKKIYNLEKLKQSNVLSLITDKCQPNSIVLFGSFMKGEDSILSDIDLFIESNECLLDLKKYEKKLNRKFQLHFKQVFTTYPKELKNNIINGNVLYGYLEAYDA